MAECVRFECTGCGYSVDAWSDGNPFYLDRSGNKVYAYHPDHAELAKCIANDQPHLCLTCGEESKFDSRLETRVCPQCCSNDVVDLFTLEGMKCPKCEDGHFAKDDEFFCIS